MGGKWTSEGRLEPLDGNLITSDRVQWERVSLNDQLRRIRLEIRPEVITTDWNRLKTGLIANEASKQVNWRRGSNTPAIAVP